MIKNRYPGKFIVLEGLDGAGKSTHTKLAADFLRESGSDVLLTQEPSFLPAGDLSRRRLAGDWDCPPESLQLLFAADRADHLAKEILPALENGAAVIADRYFLSSLAYGAVDIEMEMEWLAQINSRFLAPDLTIYLDVPPEVCVQRIAANGESAELFEKVEILEIVRHNYKKAIKMFDGEMKIVSVDGNRNKEEVFGDIINKMNVKLKNQNGR